MGSELLGLFFVVILTLTLNVVKRKGKDPRIYAATTAGWGTLSALLRKGWDGDA